MSWNDKRQLFNAELERILEELDSDEQHITLDFDPQSDSDSDLQNDENNGMAIDDEFGEAGDIDNTPENDLNQNLVSESAEALNQTGTPASHLTDVILRELENLDIHKFPEKLIGQTYDRASAMSGTLGGVQKKIKEHYPAANFVHCYAHITCVDILLCLEKLIVIEEDPKTINQAIGLKGFLQNEDFIFWLNFFHLIMPHCEILSNELQKRSIDILSVKNYIDSFKSSIQAIRDKILNDLSSSEMSTISSNTTIKRSRKNEDSKRRVALEVCDIIISEMHHRFSFSDHLVISQLFYSDQFENYKNNFPDNILNLVKKDYPSINFLKLKSELQVIYDRPDFRGSSGAVSLFQLFMNNNLSETFSETVNLLTLLCTLPMPTVERERCFSTLNRIKTFLRNTMGQDRLSALAMLSIEKSFIKGICDYNEQRVIWSPCGDGGKQREAKNGQTNQNMVLYGAPVWQQALYVKKYKDILGRTQRNILIRVASSFKTVSLVALQVVTGSSAIDLMTFERTYIHNNAEEDRKQITYAVKERTLTKWQERWENESEKAQWIKRLSPEIRPSVHRLLPDTGPDSARMLPSICKKNRKGFRGCLYIL
ncbi:hat family c-terminal dimerization region [Holotrichia oblita]|uniref:Hat family c-terminal dimerization region n=1 Tax=Holotrichia oblita TaxID=644536 RepID=A0ACB9THM0_HOLOL|nr:hat family c-terminal dimerization region [Holotrichia oblita]